MSHSAHLLIPAPPRSAEEVTREFLQQLVPKDCEVMEDGAYLIVRRSHLRLKPADRYANEWVKA